MINYSKILRKSRDDKFGALSSKRETNANPYSCNYSPVSHHRFCEHKHCILDEDWIAKDREITSLTNQLKEEENYLKNGEGTYGYDRVSVYKNVLKLKKLLGERQKWQVKK